MDFLNAITLLGNFVIVPGAAYGCQLALGALGVTLIYAILRFSNFAHGETMAIGTMACILFTWLLQSWGVSFGPLPTALLALPVGIAAAIALLLATDKFVQSSDPLRAASLSTYYLGQLLIALSAAYSLA